MPMENMIVVHMLRTVHLFHKSIELGPLVSVLSTVWEEAYGFARQYRCAIAMYLMTVLSSSYGIIMDPAMN